ncbi:MAG: CorA family divalent cation transporter, partial [Candidatus Thorarchaeota archaeon]
TELIQESTQMYMRDIYDHVIRVTDYIETYRESLTSMIDIYLSSLSNRMNEVMKVLTVISTIFIPLTLIASLYGTNFTVMPFELSWVFGYPLMLGVMAAIAIVLLIYFRKINWI